MNFHYNQPLPMLPQLPIWLHTITSAYSLTPAKMWCDLATKELGVMV